MHGAATLGVGLVGLKSMSMAQAILRPLPILPMTNLIEGFDNRISLNLSKSTHDFGTGVASATFGINNSYLGPVLRVKQGQTLPFEVSNTLEEMSTIHWHGLHIPGEVDGGPHQQIHPGATWSPDVPISQHASMNWFHSHAHGKTAQQVYKGLTGVMLIEDDASLSADLPKTYGIDDFTLVLQDKTFDESGSLNYTLTETALDDGFIGLKTGWTDKAGLTFVGLNQSNDRNIITIVNKSFVDEKKYSHFSDTKLLYKTSIETFDNFNIINKNNDFYNIRNSNNTITIKSESVWNEFINLNKKENLKLSDYKDKEISFSFMKYINKFNIEDSDYKVKWSFNPLKIFQINANQ